MEKIIVDGIIRSSRDDTYCFSIRFKEQDDAQTWKDIILEILHGAGLETEIQNCYFDKHKEDGIDE